MNIRSKVQHLHNDLRLEVQHLVKLCIRSESLLFSFVLFLHSNIIVLCCNKNPCFLSAGVGSLEIRGVFSKPYANMAFDFFVGFLLQASLLFK